MPKSKSYFQKSRYDAIYIVESNISSSFFLDIASNDYGQLNKFAIKPDDAVIHRDSCSVSYKDKLYFYGGSNHSNIIIKFDCDETEIHSRTKFNFVAGTCASNNNYILLCFPAKNKRLCYKSKSPLPYKWWQWFTYVELSYATHDSIAVSSGNKTVRF